MHRNGGRAGAGAEEEEEEEEDPGARYPKLMKRLTAVKYSRANLRAAQIQSASGSALPPMRTGTH